MANSVETKTSEDLKDLASIARLVTYARGQTNEMNAEFATYCLDLALGAVLQEMSNRGMDNIVADDETSGISFVVSH